MTYTEPDFLKGAATPGLIKGASPEDERNANQRPKKKAPWRNALLGLAIGAAVFILIIAVLGLVKALA